MIHPRVAPWLLFNHMKWISVFFLLRTEYGVKNWIFTADPIFPAFDTDMSATQPSHIYLVEPNWATVATLPDDHDAQLTRMLINSNRARDTVRQNKLLGILCRYRILGRTYSRLGKVPGNLSFEPWRIQGYVNCVSTDQYPSSGRHEVCVDTLLLLCYCYCNCYCFSFTFYFVSGVSTSLRSVVSLHVNSHYGVSHEVIVK